MFRCKDEIQARQQRTERIEVSPTSQSKAQSTQSGTTKKHKQRNNTASLTLQMGALRQETEKINRLVMLVTTESAFASEFVDDAHFERARRSSPLSKSKGRLRFGGCYLGPSPWSFPG